MEFTSRLQLAADTLVVTVHEPVATDRRAGLTQDIHDLITEHRPTAVVFELTPTASTTTAVSVILRLARHCDATGTRLAVATPVPAIRHLINANQPALPVHAHVHDALTATRRHLPH
ncbi:STAS domain-containing protein [Streptomyces sp. NPDC097619]|uniref:STAS domain-containing protein n=1 Tax=Streptomyces sp. NPDC097619 TaxID=3157228 RepID=UPI00332CF5AC